MRIVCISDTHERHRRVQVPDGDVLVHAGDFTIFGEERYIRDFNDWLGTLPHANKVVICGNHEMLWTPEKIAMLTNATYLQDSSVVIDDCKFYGSPYTPAFMNWAFMIPRGKLFEHWCLIPEDTDVLITHGPPMGTLDTSRSGGEHLGCGDLKAVVDALDNIKLHVFGHIHGGYGQEIIKGRIAVNASVVDERYNPVNAPIVVDIWR